MMTPEVYIGPLAVGAKHPRLVGIISSNRSIPFLQGDPAPGCELVELRLDRMNAAGDPQWVETARTVARSGYPVIATLRWEAEGGAWKAPDTARAPLLRKAMEVCAAVDVELQSVLCDEMAVLAKEQGKALIVSYHDFEHTPPLDTLRSVVRRAALNAQVIVKIAVQVNATDDIRILEELLSEPAPAPLCLIGMGEMGRATRIDFPRHGSCLAYGHLDGSTAPGQWSCAELAEKLKSCSKSGGRHAGS